jgi:NADH-quinone oxidoreductase subunit N
MKLFLNVFVGIFYILQPVLLVVASGSILIGAINALCQIKIKSFIAYTSINQIGFILIGVSCGSYDGFISALIYLLLYILISLSFFHIILNTGDAV